MNKKFFILSLLSLITGAVYADNKFSAVTPQEVPQGGKGNLIINYSFDNEGDFTAYSLQLVLPEGITMVVGADGFYEVIGGECNASSHDYASNLYEGEYYLTCSSTRSAPFTGTSGVLMTIPVNVSEDLELNKEYPVQIKNVRISYLNGTSIQLENVDFNVKIVENRITLDETVGITEETPTGEQNVQVKRTIKGGQWSTLVLPFAMTSEQVAEAFGEDTKLAEFTGCTTVNNEDDEATSITVKFESLTDKAIEANHPYIIYVENDIDEFKVDAVNVEPNEDDATVDCDEYTVGSGKKAVTYYNSFVGTYNANTVLDEDILFISGNKFYYSNGNTKMKAFRGYFDFYDVLADKTVSAAKIGYTVNDEATSIEGISSYQIVEGVYDLSGRKIKVQNNDLNTLQKGVYIIDGKKVTIK